MELAANTTLLLRSFLHEDFLESNVTSPPSVWWEQRCSASIHARRSYCVIRLARRQVVAQQMEAARHRRRGDGRSAFWVMSAPVDGFKMVQYMYESCRCPTQS